MKLIRNFGLRLISPNYLCSAFKIKITTLKIKRKKEKIVEVNFRPVVIGKYEGDPALSVMVLWKCCNEGKKDTKQTEQNPQ